MNEKLGENHTYIQSELDLLRNTVQQCIGSPEDWMTEKSVIQLLSRILTHTEKSLKINELSEAAQAFHGLQAVSEKLFQCSAQLGTEFLALVCEAIKIVEDHSTETAALLQELGVRLQALEQTVNEAGYETIEKSYPRNAETSSEDCKILVVEDNLVNRKVLGAMLKKYGDCDYAGDGSEGLFQFLIALEEGVPYNLIFLDILMPNLDGREMLRMIRLYEQERGIAGLDGVKVVMTTCLDDSASILGSFREGCEAYLTKPILKEKFDKVIQDMIPEKS